MHDVSSPRPPCGVPLPGRRRQIGLALTTVLTSALLAVSFLCVGPASAASVRYAGYGYTDGFGEIHGYQGMCLDVLYGYFYDYSPVDVYNCNGNPNQQWIVNPRVSGGGGIAPQANEISPDNVFCLDVRGGGVDDGTPVDIYHCNGTGAQVWVPGNSGSLVNPQSGKCLDDPRFGGSGNWLQIYDCNGGANQSWSLPTPW